MASQTMAHSMPRIMGAAGLALLVVLCGGCSQDPLGRKAISGVVKVDGAPLGKGNISFEPLEGQPTAGGSVIQEGGYAVPRDGGLVPGKYRVSIHAAVPGAVGVADENALPGDPAPAPKELIPKEWNTASQETIDVKKDGKNVFDFEVDTKGTATKAKS